MPNGNNFKCATCKKEFIKLPHSHGSIYSDGKMYDYCRKCFGKIVYGESEQKK